MERQTLSGAVRSFDLGHISGETLQAIGEEVAIDLMCSGDTEVSYHGDDVSVTVEKDDLYLSGSFSVKTDYHGEAYVSHEGYGFIENLKGEYFIVEDLYLESECVERDIPNITQIRRDAAMERRDREAEYRRMVL